MGEHTIKLPDVGEGVAEAELVEWNVKIGDLVREDTVLAAVMTDKATVEIPSPVDGEVSWIGAEIGDTVAVGSPIVRIKTSGADEDTEQGEPAAKSAKTKTSDDKPVPETPTGASENKPANEKPGDSKKDPVRSADSRSSAGHRPPAAPRPEGEKPLASPAVRLRAREAGIDLRRVAGTGPASRIGHEDIDAYLRADAKHPAGPARAADKSVEEIKIVGLRRRIAEKMALAKSRIPHITYVEEVDVTALEDLRAALNKQAKTDRPKLTLLSFLIQAMVVAIREQPRLNAHFDDDAGIVRQYGGIHVGIAAQTDSGLVVPVVRHAEARDLWDCAVEVHRLAESARAGTATREELGGSTITITSLGAMGGVATTPVINHPEVAIVGVNKMMIRPMWDGGAFQPRKMMNLSSSFDHRVIDGWDAAVFIQRIKALLETPAMIFVEP